MCKKLNFSFKTKFRCLDTYCIYVLATYIFISLKVSCYITLKYIKHVQHLWFYLSFAIVGDTLTKRYNEEAEQKRDKGNHRHRDHSPMLLIASHWYRIQHSGKISITNASAINIDFPCFLPNAWIQADMLCLKRRREMETENGFTSGSAECTGRQTLFLQQSLEEVNGQSLEGRRGGERTYNINNALLSKTASFSRGQIKFQHTSITPTQVMQFIQDSLCLNTAASWKIPTLHQTDNRCCSI